ncbi:unnamed protein product [Caenorhabditis brenneri]
MLEENDKSEAQEESSTKLEENSEDESSSSEYDSDTDSGEIDEQDLIVRSPEPKTNGTVLKEDQDVIITVFPLRERTSSGGETESDEDEKAEEEQKEEEIPANEDIIAKAVRLAKNERQIERKDIPVVLTSIVAMATVIYLVVTMLGLTVPARPLVLSRGAAKPFFMPHQRKLIEDSYDGAIRLSRNNTMSVVLLYSPYSIKSKWFRDEYYSSAKSLKKLHGDLTPYFGATNCFDTNSYCRRKYNLKQYPALMAQNAAGMASVYNGPLSSSYLTRWINRLQTPLFRLHSTDDLMNLAKNHDVLVILYYHIRTPPTTYQSAVNFTKLAFHYLDGDPNTERVIFCMVTDANLAAQFQLHNEHDVVLVSSELKLLATHYMGWANEALYNDIVKFSKLATQKKIEFLNLGKRFHSTQLAEKLDKGSVLLYFTKPLSYGNDKYKMLRGIVEEYRTCPEKDMISIENEAEEEAGKFMEDCSVSLESSFCKANNTLSFMMIDSKVESALAAKYGADKEDMVVAINSKQEITRFIRKNITRENIVCLIRQHHNAADNEFVTESTEIITVRSSTPPNIHCDAVGEPSYIRFVSNTSELLASKKINVIMFSGGIWHSASSSAIAPFHLVADHFKESRNLIDFSMVDVSETNLPYNLNFDQLPKILVTSADSVGLSWTYPEEFMINHTNIARFVLSRPGKIFGRLRWMDSCQGVCRKNARREIQNERLQLKRQLSRNVANSVRQREKLGYYDKMLRLIS